MKCHYHPEREAQYTCAECGKPICEECAHTDGVKALCKECYQTLGVKDVNKDYNKFWAFVFSLLPGAAHMYLGLMQRGFILMVIFLGLISLMNLFFIGPLPAFAFVILWFYSFFDAHHIIKKVKNNEIVLDKPFFRLDIQFKSLHAAYGLLIVGSLSLLNVIFKDYVPWHVIYKIRTMLFPLLLIGLGAFILFRIKRAERNQVK